MRSAAFSLNSIRTALVCSVLTLFAAGVCRGQEGYSLQSGKVVVDSREHWERCSDQTATDEVAQRTGRFYRRRYPIRRDGDHGQRLRQGEG